WGEGLGSRVPWLFGGTADAARGLLSTIAGSLITVATVAFSITIVAVQQAASQYSPRVLRTFTNDRGNQIVLGMFIATFTYALLVMRQVRTSGEGQGGFVPAMSITVAIVLSLGSLGLLIYFFHHSTELLRVEHILNAVRRETARELDRL